MKIKYVLHFGISGKSGPFFSIETATKGLIKEIKIHNKYRSEVPIPEYKVVTSNGKDVTDKVTRLAKRILKGWELDKRVVIYVRPEIAKCFDVYFSGNSSKKSKAFSAWACSLQKPIKK